MLKFNWGPADVAWSLVAVGALSAISFAVLPRLLVPRVGETKAVFIGFVAGTIGYAGYAFAPHPAVLYSFMVVFCFGGVGGAALNAILSHLVPNNEQGELQGAIASIGSLTSVVSPLVMTGLFAHFTGPGAPVYFPGASFLAAAICELGALVIFAAAKARKAATMEPVT
jgi:DHA1 family tetracycline resistance protein-like MFS transporter